jgi:alkaline phosphatase D
MKKLYKIVFLGMLVCSCKTANVVKDSSVSKVTIAFGSCNKSAIENVFWDDILSMNPDVFIWGGDNIYADTDDIVALKRMYDDQNAIPAYTALKEKVFITGTWDDHDYGLNDGGIEFTAKRESQQVFLDFMDVKEDDPRRDRAGVYSTQTISKPTGLVKIINLDTRYFRDKLIKSKIKGRRYDPNMNSNASMLGEEQWRWLEAELTNSKAKFNLIVTSIQFLSSEHGFEKWANFPYEVDKMKRLIASTKAKGVIFLSGDRHISEFSKTKISGVSYPIIDFTSSGLTHSYSNFSTEPNRYREGEVVSSTSFGTLELDLDKNEVVFKMMGNNNEVQQQLKQSY